MRALETARGLAGGLRGSEPNNNSIEISYQPGSTNLPLKFQICLFIPFLPSLIGETNCKQTKHCHSCLIFSLSLLGICSQILSDLSLSFTPHLPSPQLWYHQHALIFVFRDEVYKFTSNHTELEMSVGNLKWISLWSWISALFLMASDHVPVMERYLSLFY